jgi:hypothetical protein
VIAALFTSAETVPSSSAVTWNSRSTAAGSPTSVPTPIALPPDSRIEEILEALACRGH